jgi:hypothetical protein
MYGLPIMTSASFLVRFGSLISQNSADYNELKAMLAVPCSSGERSARPPLFL